MATRRVIFPTFRPAYEFDYADWGGIGQWITNTLGNLGGLLGKVSDVKGGTQSQNEVEIQRIKQEMEEKRMQTWTLLGVMGVVAVVLVLIFKKK